ncbi:hypothetical protein [Agromyces agglutinans]|uniref:hypothetical protein n=1 Tax=Agromyces agglutinans TaxID=2662258 RepID=UPI001561BBD4|nr:hypothetical protein [Agromyces agglutinans]
MDTPKQIILRLLKSAAAAHGVYEAERLGGIYDDEWPEWYAGYMAVGLTSEGYRVVRDRHGEASEPMDFLPPAARRPAGAGEGR